MKFNWGTGITIAIVLFMSFILFMVFKATQTESDLNAENYYEQEMAYQERIDAIANAKDFKDEIEVDQSGNELKISFPADMVEEGKVHLFRPDNAGLDVELPIEKGNTEVMIPKEQMVLGVYQVQLSWKKGDKEYYYEEKVTVK